ncbi:MAG: hypothetical protein QM765_25395 [Myxococcales bacterium]
MFVARRQRPACRRRTERGILHGLSLLVITVLVFGTLAYFAFGHFPLRCACKDGSAQRGVRNGFDSPQAKCEQLCAGRGGGAPVMKGAAKDKDDNPRQPR